MPELDQTRVAEIRETAYEYGAPWNAGRADEIERELAGRIAAIDARLDLTAGGGAHYDLSNFDSVTALLAKNGIGREAQIDSFADTWKLPQHFRAIHERWFLSESCKFAGTLERTITSSGRVVDPVLLAALAPQRYRFSELPARFLVEHWLDAIRVEEPERRALLVLSWKQALPSVAAWLTDDTYLAEAIRSDRLYELPFSLRATGGLAPQAYAVMAWLHGAFDGQSVREFLGRSFGSGGEAEPLEEQMRALNYESSLAAIDSGKGYARWLGAQKAEFITELEPTDYDVEFQKSYGGAERKDMQRFHPDRFQAHIETTLSDARFHGITTMLMAIADTLGTEFKVVACVRDSVVVEGDRVALETIQPELVASVRSILSSVFPGMVVPRIEYGIGQSWAEALANARNARASGVEGET